MKKFKHRFIILTQGLKEIEILSEAIFENLFMYDCMFSSSKRVVLIFERRPKLSSGFEAIYPIQDIITISKILRIFKSNKQKGTNLDSLLSEIGFNKIKDEFIADTEKLNFSYSDIDPNDMLDFTEIYHSMKKP